MGGGDAGTNFSVHVLGGPMFNIERELGPLKTF
jgi:hypothetical protein